MYQLKVSKEKELSVYELYNETLGSWLRVAPDRGGIITSFGVENDEILFLNKETLYDPKKNIRGGIPILFPISGQLENGEYEWNDKVYKMKNHGVARNHSWEVIDTDLNETKATVTIRLVSNEETMREYPFQFEVIFSYTITKNELLIDQVYRNISDESMPIYAGFHPYFKTSSKDLTYQTDAKTYLDYNTMEVNSFNDSLDLTNKKESLVLMDSMKKQISFELPELKKKVTMRYGDEFKYIVLWTEAEQEFICVEPWMAMTDELNRKEELVMVEPGNSLHTSLVISVQ
ncbi:aldose epimerase [Bacillus sp. AFS076308]|uniref:aldose epimerase family protein n=1 Tax=unclassified Bacillus (in: firmicutes) TaxID=185979 RepID=UPI000BF4B423|nr:MULTISPECIES: aldose epimerase [unclassified Bacillus (in: firmicutes)]PFO04919.1 aldose epimerase [Bacillus sp. AFS076308]PGV51016.1 aldose epimerase [Bacillus sp. AFS037270]